MPMPDHVRELPEADVYEKQNAVEIIKQELGKYVTGPPPAAYETIRKELRKRFGQETKLYSFAPATVLIVTGDKKRIEVIF